MTDRRERTDQGFDLTAGLPQTRHSALTPVGEIEQAAKIAEGLRVPRTGWRRVVVTIGLVALALIAAGTLVGWTLSAGAH